MESKTQPVLAISIEVTAEWLVVVTETGAVPIPWAKCSGQAELSPSGYGIHWPLIDENLAVGPLVQTGC